MSITFYISKATIKAEWKSSGKLMHKKKHFVRNMSLSSGCPTQTSSSSSPSWRSATWPQTRSRAMALSAGTTSSLKGCGGSVLLPVAASITEVRETETTYTCEQKVLLYYFIYTCACSSHIPIQPPVCVTPGGCRWSSSGWETWMHLSGGTDAKEWTTAEEAQPRPWYYWLCHL